MTNYVVPATTNDDDDFNDGHVITGVARKIFRGQKEGIKAQSSGGDLGIQAPSSRRRWIKSVTFFNLVVYAAYAIETDRLAEVTQSK